MPACYLDRGVVPQISGHLLSVFVALVCVADLLMDVERSVVRVMDGVYWWWWIHILQRTVHHCVHGLTRRTHVDVHRRYGVYPQDSWLVSPPPTSALLSVAFLSCLIVHISRLEKSIIWTKSSSKSGATSGRVEPCRQVMISCIPHVTPFLQKRFENGASTPCAHTCRPLAL